jgi:hypothetical protein
VTDFEALLRALTQAGVEFIVIGGAAATAHGAVRLTLDLDIVYARSTANLERLATALGPLQPYLRGAPPGLPFSWSAVTLGHGLNFTLTTRSGDIDLLGEIAGGGRYESLVPHAVEMRLFGMPVRVLGLAKLIEVKRAAGRPKDFEAIAELQSILDEQG